MVTTTTATISKSGFTSVNIEATKIEHNADNQINVRPIPSKNASDTKTWIIDLSRVKEAVTVTGFLLDQATSSAQTKKANLLSIIRDDSGTTRAVSVQWGDSPYSEASGNVLTGSIAKWSITETPGTLTDNSSSLGTDTRIFDITIQLVRGTVKGKG